MSQHLYQISQSTNSPTMKGILVQSKFILFRVVNSISFSFLKDLPSYNHTQYRRGMVSKMATPTVNIPSTSTLRTCTTPGVDARAGRARQLMRILARVLRRVGHLYELQTKHGVLQSRCGPQTSTGSISVRLNRMLKELGNNRRKITLTIYCHRRSGECPNKATGPNYNQITVLQQQDGDEMEE